MYQVDVRVSYSFDGVHQVGQFSCKFLGQRQESRGGVLGGGTTHLLLLLPFLLLHTVFLLI